MGLRTCCRSVGWSGAMDSRRPPPWEHPDRPRARFRGGRLRRSHSRGSGNRPRARLDVVPAHARRQAMQAIDGTAARYGAATWIRARGWALAIGVAMMAL